MGLWFCHTSAESGCPGPNTPKSRGKCSVLLWTVVPAIMNSCGHGMCWCVLDWWKQLSISHHAIDVYVHIHTFLIIYSSCIHILQCSFKLNFNDDKLIDGVRPEKKWTKYTRHWGTIPNMLAKNVDHFLKWHTVFIAWDFGRRFFSDQPWPIQMSGLLACWMVISPRMSGTHKMGRTGMPMLERPRLVLDPWLSPKTTC